MLNYSFALRAALACFVCLCVVPAQAGYVDAVTALQPIDYWRLGETTDDAIDQGTPNTPNGTYGSAVNRGVAGPSPSNGFVGFDNGNAAARFPASGNNANSGINMGNYAPVTGNNARTVLAWINPAAVDAPMVNPSGQRTILYYGAESTSQRFRVQLTENRFGVDVHTRAVNGTTTLLSTDQWYFVAAVLPPASDINTVELYVNGILQTGKQFVGGGTAINTGSTENFMLGRHPDKVFDFHGIIDEVAIFDRALTQSEIQALFTAANTAAVPEPSTLLLAGLLVGALPWIARRRRALKE